jgi:hypothetical protein
LLHGAIRVVSTVGVQFGRHASLLTVLGKMSILKKAPATKAGAEWFETT